ncbi:hypothetical protein BT69DRAFT_1219260, partial [Atractiella rhizophila]
GQSYVALSRATSLEGLQVLRFDPKKVLAHPKVVEWTKKMVVCLSHPVLFLPSNAHHTHFTMIQCRRTKAPLPAPNSLTNTLHDRFLRFYS